MTMLVDVVGFRDENGEWELHLYNSQQLQFLITAPFFIGYLDSRMRLMTMLLLNFRSSVNSNMEDQMVDEELN